MKRRLLILPLISLLISGCNFFGPTSNPTKPTTNPTVTTDSSSSSSSISQSSSSSTSEEPKDVYPTKISLSPSSKIVNPGDEFDISIAYTPENTTIKEVTWTSTNSFVATVDDNGHVTTHNKGTASIKATAKRKIGSISASCSVTVKDEEGTITKSKLKYTYEDYIKYNASQISSCPLEDNPKLLIIPIWFTDSTNFIDTSKKETVREDIRKTYVGTNEETGWRSVKTFYEEESKGTMSLDATVSSWYSCGDSYTKYTSKTTGRSNTRNLVSKATTWYFTNNPSDSKSNYDTDDNGYLDGVMLIYGAPDYGTYGGSSNSNLWAYCFWLQTEAGTVSAPEPNVFFWASYDFMYGSNATSRTGKSYGGGDTTYCNLDTHTYIHEMGHVLGLEDYYDYSEQYNPAGGFSMQDANVGGHDPYSVMAYGWADPYIPTESMEITINDFQSSHDLILLSDHAVDSPFDEYLLLELYTPTGLNKFDSDHQYSSRYPQGPSVPGIRLWHIDARLTNYLGGEDFSTSLTTNPKTNYVTHAMSNTYDDEDYGSPLGEDYYDYNILQLIRNSSTIDYHPTSNLSESSLFKTGSSFNMSTYSKQFVKGTTLNNGKALGWSFSVQGIADNQAVISLTKLS